MKTPVTILVLLISINLSLAEAIGIDIKLTYVQKADNTYLLKTTITDVEDEEPVPGLELKYSVSISGESVVLGTATTTTKGTCVFAGNLADLRSKGHQFKFYAAFAGNDEFEENEVEVEITDAVLTLSTEVVDSVNTVVVSLKTWNEDGEEMPIADEDIKLFVPRMFSLLPIVDAYTSEEGEDEVEFPGDIPGGPLGELLIIGKLDEHEKYGTIESQSETSWGTPVSLIADSLPRALWSPNAPMWMVITFIILMTGVWGHYFWIIFNLFRIKKMADKNAPISYAE